MSATIEHVYLHLNLGGVRKIRFTSLKVGDRFSWEGKDVVGKVIKPPFKGKSGVDTVWINTEK